MGYTKLPHYCLGQTDLKISKLGLGTVKFGRNTQVKYPSSFNLPSDSTIIELLALTQQLGINLLDTAPAYGDSESKLGKLFALNAGTELARSNWVLSTKVGEEFTDNQSRFDFSPQHINFSIERSLRRLRTDYLDIVLVHSDGNDLKIIEENNVFEILSKLKSAGKIRAYGMSTKTVAGGLRALELSDIVMASYNMGYLDELPVLQKAAELNKGLLIKKAFNSGHCEDFSASLNFVLQQPGVSSIIIGTINPEHLIGNVNALYL